MSVTVRIFAHKGLTALPVVSQQYQTDMVAHLDQPYLAREKLTVTDSAAVSSSAATAPARTRVLFVQVQDGGRVHYEVYTNSGDAGQVDATTDSPIGRGDFTLQWNEGWLISFLEAV